MSPLRVTSPSTTRPTTSVWSPVSKKCSTVQEYQPRASSQHRRAFWREPAGEPFELVVDRCRGLLGAPADLLPLRRHHHLARDLVAVPLVQQVHREGSRLAHEAEGAGIVLDRGRHQPRLEGHLHHPVGDHQVAFARGAHRPDHVHAVAHLQERLLDRFEVEWFAGDAGERRSGVGLLCHRCCPFAAPATSGPALGPGFRRECRQRHCSPTGVNENGPCGAVDSRVRERRTASALAVAACFAGPYYWAANLPSSGQESS